MQYGTWPPEVDKPHVPHCPLRNGRTCAHSKFPIPDGMNICTSPHEPELYIYYPLLSLPEQLKPRSLESSSCIRG